MIWQGKQIIFGILFPPIFYYFDFIGQIKWSFIEVHYQISNIIPIYIKSTPGFFCTIKQELKPKIKKYQ
ncbi:Uncharacterised protein [Chlamydia trachomatis]|nr:Uncharacterised protein [Chlamydia trachomatis]